MVLAIALNKMGKSQPSASLQFSQESRSGVSGGVCPAGCHENDSQGTLTWQGGMTHRGMSLASFWEGKVKEGPQKRWLDDGRGRSNIPGKGYGGLTCEGEFEERMV